MVFTVHPTAGGFPAIFHNQAGRLAERCCRDVLLSRVGGLHDAAIAYRTPTRRHDGVHQQVDSIVFPVLVLELDPCIARLTTCST